jgi:hypothetical protein
VYLTLVATVEPFPVAPGSVRATRKNYRCAFGRFRVFLFRNSEERLRVLWPGPIQPTAMGQAYRASASSILRAKSRS